MRINEISEIKEIIKTARKMEAGTMLRIETTFLARPLYAEPNNCMLDDIDPDLVLLKFFDKHRNFRTHNIENIVSISIL